ncbi:MAG: hypothetical protein SGPRY_013487, partial [Prymnesium sp.]
MGKNPAVVQGPATDMRVARSIGKAVKADRACKVLVLNFRGGREAHPFWNMLSVNLVKNQGDTIFHMASLQDYTYTIGKLVSLTPAQFCRSAQFHQRQRHVGDLKQDLLPVPMIYEADELVELNNPAGVRGTEVLVKRLSWDRLTLEPEILMSCIADILNGLEARYELVESKDDNGAQFAAHVRMDDLAFRIM